MDRQLRSLLTELAELLEDYGGASIAPHEEGLLVLLDDESATIPIAADAITIGQLLTLEDEE